MKSVLFFNINGSGLGHLNRCLSYARAIHNEANITFFSLASATEVIESMGFPADYFISPFWSVASNQDWNTELAYRFGMLLNSVHPDAVIFDGTWPFDGFLSACADYGHPLKKIWSRRGLFKEKTTTVSVDERLFDAVLCPGEVGTTYAESRVGAHTCKFTLPPVTLLNDAELLSKEEARRELGLEENGRYALFSLGPGNLKDVSSVGCRLLAAMTARGFDAVWAQAPISVKDVPLPEGVRPLRVYPLVKYMRAFDAFIGAAGYNTCCEVVQTQVPSLIVPNTLLADDQARRAHLIAHYAPVVVNACEDEAATQKAVEDVLHMMKCPPTCLQKTLLNGADYAAQAIVRIAEGKQ